MPEIRPISALNSYYANIKRYVVIITCSLAMYDVVFIFMPLSLILFWDIGAIEDYYYLVMLLIYAPGGIW